MTTTQKVALLDIENREVLFARTKGQTLFYNVGGRVEPGETHEQALIRECKEEMSVDIIPGTLEFVHSFKGERLDKPGEFIEIHCYNAGYEGEPVPSSEIEELDWFTSNDMQRTTPTGQQILLWLKEQNLID